MQQKNANNNSRLSSSSTPLSFCSRAATLSSVRLRRVLTSWTRTWLDSTLDWSSENDIGLVIKSAVGTVAMVAVKGGNDLLPLQAHERFIWDGWV